VHKSNDKRIEHCLQEDEIENYLLQNGLHEEELRISDHIGSCYDCYLQYFDLRTFHQILNSELSKPISRRIKDLVKGISKN
jgi:hypothetical protein